MTVEVGKGVIYRWNNIRENELASIASWTDASKAISDVTDDVLFLAKAFCPRRTYRLVESHYKAGHKRTGRFRIEQVVGNNAPYAAWVHEGTRGGPSDGKLVVFRPGGGYMGPVSYGEVSIRRGKRWLKAGSGGRAGRSGVYFAYYTFGGQSGNDWLDRAGRAAYRLPGNN